MGKGKRKPVGQQAHPGAVRGMKANVVQKPVPSLLDAIVEGREYESIIGKVPPDGWDPVPEMKKALSLIEAIRGRPCIAYIGDVVKTDAEGSGIDSADDLPFAELVASVPGDARAVDVLLATRGGSAHQVNQFVTRLRARFESVEFLIPSTCMSAGTLFALSGDKIWMTPRACLGPIDPQVPTAGGRYVPAQAILLLVDKLQNEGEKALKASGSVPWTMVRIIDTIDKKELGEAITASAYSVTMASEFLLNYKFKNWTVRETSQVPVTPQYRSQRAGEVATALVSHERWKNHGHAIARDVLWNEIRLKIDHPDADLEVKVFMSQNYAIMRIKMVGGAP
jgi:hypothetical protein